MIEMRMTTFKNISLKKLRIELQRPITVLDDVLVQLQLAIAESSIAEKSQHKHKRKNKFNRSNYLSTQ